MFEPGTGFFNAPFPSDARRTENGAPDFSGLPNPGGIGFVDVSIAAARERDGFDPSGAVYFRFDRPPPWPGGERPVNSATELPGVSIVDVDPDSPERLRRFPAMMRMTDHHDGVRPAHLLQILPLSGIGLREGTTYAVIVETDVDQDGDSDLGSPAALRALLDDEGGAVAYPAWREAFAPLRRALGALALAPDDVAAATVFTTGNPTAELFRWTKRASDAPPPELKGPLVREREHEGYVVLKGVLKMPIYQEGTPPHFFGGGRLVTDADGNPVVQRHEDAPFYLSVPKGDVPEGGVPHYFYVHGTGGLATQALDRGYRNSVDDVSPKGSGLASWVAPLGFATSCIAGTYSPDRIGLGALDGYGAYVFFRPVAMRDNFRQMILEQVHFLRALEELRIDPALVPEAKTKDGEPIRFSQELRVVGGQSLGSFLSGMLAAVTGAFDGAVLTGAGGSWIEFGFGPKDPVDLTMLIDLYAMPKGERVDKHHPFITAFQTAVGPADNTLYTPYIVRRPRDGARVPHVLIIEGQRDLQVALNVQRSLVVSVGADLVGPDVGERPEEWLSPPLYMAGLDHVPDGLAGNRRAPDGSPRTVVVTNHSEDGILEGHYVLFQKERPKEQLKAFLRGLKQGEAPLIK